MEFPGLVEQAKIFVPGSRRPAATWSSSAPTPAPTPPAPMATSCRPENASTLVAEQVPGIDAILVGHAHREITPALRHQHRDRQAGAADRAALLGHARLASSTFDAANRPRPPAGPAVGDLADAQLQHRRPGPGGLGCRAGHHDVVVYVRQLRRRHLGGGDAGGASAVGRTYPSSTSSTTSRRDAVKAALTGSDAELPVISIAAPFSRAAAFPAGEVTVRDVAGLYIYDNTLMAVRSPAPSSRTTWSSPPATSSRSAAPARSRSTP